MPGLCIVWARNTSVNTIVFLLYTRDDQLSALADRAALWEGSTLAFPCHRGRWLWSGFTGKCDVIIHSKCHDAWWSNDKFWNNCGKICSSLAVNPVLAFDFFFRNVIPIISLEWSPTFQNKPCCLTHPVAYFVIWSTRVLPSVSATNVLNQQSAFLQHGKPWIWTNTFTLSCPVCKVCGRISRGNTW